MAVELDHSGIRLDEKDDAAGQRRLAAARLAGEAEDLLAQAQRLAIERQAFLETRLQHQGPAERIGDVGALGRYFAGAAE